MSSSGRDKKGEAPLSKPAMSQSAPPTAAAADDVPHGEQVLATKTQALKARARLTHRLSSTHLDMVRRGLDRINTQATADAAHLLDELEQQAADKKKGEKHDTSRFAKLGEKIRAGGKADRKSVQPATGEAEKSLHYQTQTQSTLRLQSELLNVEVAQLCVQKAQLENIIREADAAKKKLKVVTEQIEQKRAAMAETMRNLKATGALENLLSLIPDSTRRESMLDALEEDFMMPPDKNPEVLFSFHGPPTGFARPAGATELPDESKLHTHDPHCAGRALSLYPTIDGRRQGDPIADRYHMIQGKEFIIAALADGCGWGVASAEAARIAAAAFTSYMTDFLYEVDSPSRAVRFMLRAFKVSHESIIDGAGEEELFQRGTSTMLGCVLLPAGDKCQREHMTLRPHKLRQMEHASGTSPPPQEKHDQSHGHEHERPPLLRQAENRELVKNDEKWVLVWLSVGDCKALRWSSKTGTLRDITEGNRMNVNDTRDPGGRLGPYQIDGSPDIRNVAAGVQLCSSGDIISLVSDGVHDNLDPQYLGHGPADLGVAVKTGGDPTNWDDVADGDEALDAKTLWSRKLMDVLVGGKESTVVESEEYATPANLTEKLTTHADLLSLSAREQMERGNKQPEDHKTFPGKMDHATALSFRVPARSPYPQ